MYNIVYSITFHQSVDFVNHFLKNIEKYNKENNYLVIIHLSDNLYNQKDNFNSNLYILKPYLKRLFKHTDTEQNSYKRPPVAYIKAQIAHLLSTLLICHR